MDGDGRAYSAILQDRFPREKGETDQEWLDRIHGYAEEDRIEPDAVGKVIRSAQ